MPVQALTQKGIGSYLSDIWRRRKQEYSITEEALAKRREIAMHAVESSIRFPGTDYGL